MSTPIRSLILGLLLAPLLPGTLGTAFAQPRLGFTPSQGTVSEGATAGSAQDPLLMVTVRVWGLPAGPAGSDSDGQPMPRQQAIDALGDITIETDGIGPGQAATIAPVYDTAAALNEDAVFARSDTFQLTVTPVQDQDAKSDRFTLRLRSTEQIRTGLAYRGTVIDDDPLATASFSRTSVGVVEGSTTSLRIRIDAPAGQEFPTLPAGQRVVLDVTPASAVGTADCPPAGEPKFPLRVWSETETLTYRPGVGEITIGRDVRDYERGPAQLQLTACDDMSSFGNSQVTLSFRASSLDTPEGRIAAGPPAAIRILNDDPVPVVSFGTVALTIDEGKAKTVAILTDGRLAGEVMQAGVAVTGDARISLSQSGNPLWPSAGGAYPVALGVNGSAILTVRAVEDDNLADNQTKTATVTLVDASGAEIGNRDSLTITVRGSIAIPALPLVGQLVLVLLLLASGARPYCGRRGN